jgi:hypothetical protein
MRDGDSQITEKHQATIYIHRVNQVGTDHIRRTKTYEFHTLQHFRVGSSDFQEKVHRCHTNVTYSRRGGI